MKSSSAGIDSLASELVAQTDFVRRMARALLRDQQVAEDVVQETMLAAIQHRPDPDAGLQVWLKSVLRRRVLLHFRNEQRRSAREYLSLRDAGEEASSEESEAERASDALARSTQLGNVVAGLSEPYRTVITMRYFESLPPREIAERLERPLATINTQIQRGLQKLRQQLDDANDGDRRAWVVALLPHALYGRKGWWPASVGGAFGVAYGTLAQVALLLIGLALGVRAITAPSRGPELTEPVQRQLDPLMAAASASPPQAVDDDQEALRSSLSVPSNSEGAEAAVPLGPENPGTLRIFLHANEEPIAGVKAIAAPHSMSDMEEVKVYGRGIGPGNAVAVIYSDIVVRKPPKTIPPGRAPRFAESDSDGILELPVLDGQAWLVSLIAEGFTRQAFDIQESSASLERRVELQAGGRVVVNRGGFPVDATLVVEVKNPFGGVEHQMVMRPGMQEGQLVGVPPGPSRLSAVNLEGPEIGNWSLPVEVLLDQVTQVDLSKGGCTHTQIDVRGADFATTPKFAQIQRLAPESGQVLWSLIAGIHDGLANFHGVPPGPALIRINSSGSELARMSFVAESGDRTQKVKVDVSSGTIRVQHGGAEGREFSWSLAVRSDTDGARAGWITLGEPLWGAGESVFYGCKPGSYRLWMLRGSTVRRFDFEHDGGAVLLNASPDLSVGDTALHELRADRGPGLEAEAKIEVQLSPGTWRALDGGDGVLRLSTGTHRLRCALEGLGFATADVTVPGLESIALAETAPPQAVLLTYGMAEPVQTLRVTQMAPEGAINVAGNERAVFVELGEDGSGSVALRPGRYLVTDRAGRSMPLEISAEVTAAAVVF